MSQQKVYKYPIKTQFEKQNLLLPYHAQILTVGEDVAKGEGLALWALVGTDAYVKERWIQIVPTGITFTTNAKYINTFTIEQYVLHAFEIFD